MRVAGIAVNIPSRGRPTVRLVVLHDTPTVEIEAGEEIPTADAELPEQLHDVAETVRSRLKDFKVDRVVVRRADQPPRASNKEGPRLRLLAEGAVTSAARSVVTDTFLMNGKDAAARYGSNKAGLDADAAVAAAAAGLKKRAFDEAVGAGLAGLAD